MERICFLFGHADTPESAYAAIQTAVQTQYRDYHIRSFLVGNRGRFDRMAHRAVIAQKRETNDVTLLLLSPYALSMNKEDIPHDTDEIVVPPLDGVPMRARIVAANRYAVHIADTVVCYVSHIGNSKDLLEFAVSYNTPIINCAD